MEREREFQGRTLEEAIRAAAEYLGVDGSAVHYRLVDEGRLGVLGFGARPVRIAVEARSPVRHETPAPVPAAEPVREAPVKPVEPATSPEPPAALVEMVRAILKDGRFEMSARFEGEGQGWSVRLEGEDEDLFLDRDAELLHAFEFLLHRMARRAWPDAGAVRLRCGNEETAGGGAIAALAREVAEVVARTGRSRKLHPMNPYDRRIVHVTVREFPGLTSRSEGEGFLKRITVERGGRRRSKRRG